MMTAEQKTLMLDKLKLLVSPDADEVRLTFILEAVVDYILTYCHLDQLPEKLVRAAVLMAADTYTTLTLQANAPEQLGEAKSLTEGDFAIQSFSLSDMTAALASLSSMGFIKKYYKQLNACRKLP